MEQIVNIEHRLTAVEHKCEQNAQEINDLKPIIKEINIRPEDIEDVTENGKTEAYISFLDMRENVDPGVSEVMYSKLVVEVGYSEAFVFIVSQKFADYLSNEGILKPASDWTDMESYNGYCISLENCKVLEDIGIDTSDLYIGITELRERDGKSARDKNIPKQENGIKFAKFLLDKR